MIDVGDLVQFKVPLEAMAYVDKELLDDGYGKGVFIVIAKYHYNDVWIDIADPLTLGFLAQMKVSRFRKVESATVEIG